MTYLQAHNSSTLKRGKRNRLVLLICGIVIVIVIALNFLSPHLFPGLFTSIARPFWRMDFSISSGSLLSSESLMNQNEDLKRQLADAQVQLQSVSSIESQNMELLGLLGRPDAAISLYLIGATSSSASTSSINPSPYTLAAVLVRPPFSNYDELIIDAGADHGFSTTSLVYASGNILIGRVTDVLGQTSKVTLLSSPGEKYPVLVGTSHAPATAIGRGGGQYQAELPRDVQVSAGDFILAPSLSDKPFGIVTAVLTDPTMPFEKILFAPPVNVYQLRWVLVRK